MSRLPRKALAVLLALAVPVAAETDAAHDAREAVKHYRLGQGALARERYDEAEQEFRSAVRLDPLLVAAHYGLGQTMMATKRYPEAVSAYVAAREAFEDGQSLAATREMAAQRRLDDQIKALQDDVASARRQAGGTAASSIQAAIARNEDQIKTLQALRKRGGAEPLPVPHWLSLALGSAFFRAGDIDSAEREYRSALAQKPDLGEAHLNLAVVCLLTSRLDEAEREVELARQAGIRIPPGLEDDLRRRRQP